MAKKYYERKYEYEMQLTCTEEQSGVLAVSSEGYWIVTL